MAIELPFRSDGSVPLPAALQGYENGRYPGEVLVPCGLRNFVMVEPAASAMRAMVAAAARDGIVLSATGTWRSYDDQERLFRSRYTTQNTGGEKKVWKGTSYWRLPKVASAATPGTSNHGKGLAADLSNSPSVPLSGATLQWVARHGPDFGYWNTVRSEVWHWSYCLGDGSPAGVTSPPTATAAAVDWAAVAAIDAKMAAVPFPGELAFGANGDGVRAVQWKLVSSGFPVDNSGAFDQPTVVAVKAFQRSRGLTDDGRVGPKTWAALGLSGSGDRPAPPPTEAPAEPPAASAAVAATYEVRAGDGFLRIAGRTLWSSSLDAAKEIAAANGLTIESNILPGQVLDIPSCRCHVVAAGDEWPAIAALLEVDLDTVRESNAWQGEALTPGMFIYGGRSPV